VIRDWLHRYNGSLFPCNICNAFNLFNVSRSTVKEHASSLTTTYRAFENAL